MSKQQQLQKLFDLTVDLERDPEDNLTLCNYKEQKMLCSILYPEETQDILSRAKLYAQKHVAA